VATTSATCTTRSSTSTTSTTSNDSENTTAKSSTSATSTTSNGSKNTTAKSAKSKNTTTKSAKSRNTTTKSAKSRNTTTKSRNTIAKSRKVPQRGNLGGAASARQDSGGGDRTQEGESRAASERFKRPNNAYPAPDHGTRLKTGYIQSPQLETPHTLGITN
jgi:hypothetical protein